MTDKSRPPSECTRTARTLTALTARTAKPEWLRIPTGDFARWKQQGEVLAAHHLGTVCESALCPNRNKCWGDATLTFMIMGSVCTRCCSFCAVHHGTRGLPLDAQESEHLASAVLELDLRYVVLTSVDRDDLDDHGARHFAACIAAIKKAKARTRVEALIPDFNATEMDILLGSEPDVIAHNIETVERLQGVRDGRASWQRSFATLALAAEAKKTSGIPRFVKSSILLGVGETREEVLSAVTSLVRIGCDILVLGQYLQPGKDQIAVARYLEPIEFDELAQEARRLGMAEVVAAPLARTSLDADMVFKKLCAKIVNEQPSPPLATDVQS